MVEMVSNADKGLFLLDLDITTILIHAFRSVNGSYRKRINSFLFMINGEIDGLSFPVSYLEGLFILMKN